MMNLADIDLIQKNLHNDLNTLIKNINIRQEHYYKLLDSNRTILIKLKQMNQNLTIIISDEVTHYRNILNPLKNQHTKLYQEEIQISNKYKGLNVNNQSIIRLMGRVGVRILQMFQNYYEKIKGFNHNIEEKYKRMRNSLMKTLNQKDKTDIADFITIVIQYMNEKINQQIINLTELIQVLQSGELQKINEVYQKINSKKNNEKKKQQQILQQIQKQKIKEKQKQKQKIIQMKQESKNNDKIRKQKGKFVNHLVNGLYSTMQLAKNHLLQDIVCLNPQEKCKKLYQEIFTRNKFNYEQIMAFQAKNQQFHQKVKKFKQMMELQSKKIQQAIVFKSIPKKQIGLPTIEPTQLLQVIEVQQRIQQTISDNGHDLEIINLKLVDKGIQNQNRITEVKSNEIRQNILKKNTSYKNKESSPFYSMQTNQQTFQHIKFDTRQQQIYLRSNRARLPQIQSRGPSQNYQNRRRTSKNQQRVNIATQININGQSQKVRFSSKIQNFIEKNNHESKQRKKDSLPKSFQYTFYVKKRTNKFYQTRNNFII